MRKRGKKLLSTVIAGVITVSAVPWGVLTAQAEETTESEVSEISGSVVVNQDTPVLVEFEEVPAVTTAASKVSTGITTTSVVLTTTLKTQETTRINASAKITEDGYKYYITGGFVVIEGYEGNDTELSVPSIIDGIPVKEIGYGAFSGHTSVKSIIIPESIERIGHNSFSGCTGITSISVPDTVTSLGDNAFSGCTGLTSIKLPEGLTRLEDGVFSDCKSLKNISIPESTERLGKSTFFGCESLSEVTITQNISTIGDMAFYGCTSLETITVPDTVSSLGYAVFAGCTGLKSAVLPKGISALKSGDDMGMFTDCKSLESVTFPENLKNIGYSCFKGCESLKSIPLPETVTIIEHDAFSDCTQLESLTIPPQVKIVSDSVMKNCTALLSVKMPEGITAIGESAFENCSVLPEIIIPDAVTSIGNKAFCGCTALTEINVPENVNEMGYGVFCDCTSLIKAILPDGVTELNSENNTGVFKNCTSLTDVKLPAKLTYIGADSFRNCTSLKEIAIPQSVTVLESGSFAGAEKLGSISIPDGVTQIGQEAFSGCKSLIKAELPEKLELVGENAFSNCIALSDLGDKAGYFKFYEYSFDSCKRLSDPRATVFDVTGTSFDANTVNGTVGGVVNFTVRYDLNDWITEDAGECTFQWNIPEGLLLLESSVLTDDGNTLKIGNNTNVAVASNPSGVIRFSTRIQSYNENGYDIRPKISFNSHDFSWTQKLPSLNVKAPEITIGVPKLVGKETVDVYGISKPGEKVTVYVNGTKAAELNSNAYTGKYNAQVILPEPASGKIYELYAVCGDVKSETVNTTYSLTDPTIDKIEMNYCTHAPSDTNPYNANLDITDTFTEGKRPLVYYYPTGGMQFRVHANNSDQIIGMSITSTKGDDIKQLHAEYNAEEDIWETPENAYFDESNHNYVPGSLNVSIIRKTPEIIDESSAVSVIPKSEIDNISVEAVEASDTAALYNIKGTDGENYNVDCSVFTYQAPSINIGGKTVTAYDISQNPSAYGFTATGKTVVQNGVSYDLYSKEPSEVTSVEDDSLLDAALGGLADARETYEDYLGYHGCSTLIANALVPKETYSNGMENPGTVMVNSIVESQTNKGLREMRNWAVGKLPNSGNSVDILKTADTVSQYTGYVTDAYGAYVTHEERVAAANGSERLQRLADGYYAIDTIVNSGKIAADFIPGGDIWLSPMLAGLESSLDNLYGIFENYFRRLDELDAEIGWDDYYDESGSVNMVIDPSGIVYAGSESNLIDGAKMTCYKLNDKTNQWEVWNAEDYGQVNPQYTQSGGKYAWDVPEGHYYVTCEMEGFEKIFSEGFTVSPPKLDLNFNLMSSNNPVVSGTAITDNTIELEFSTYVKTETVSKESVHLEGTENPYEITAVKDNDDDIIAKKFIINGDFTDADKLTIILDDTIIGYNDLSLKKYTEELNNQGIISVPTVEALAYTGSELTGVPECEAYTVTGGTATSVGNYKAVLTLNDGYKWVGGSTEKKEVNWSIKKAEISGISVKQKSPLVYNGQSLKAEIVASGKTVDESPITFVYSTNKDGNYKNSIPTFVKPGEYAVYYKASAENHNEQTGEFKIVIDGADISDISVSQKNTLEYTGKPLTAVVEATGKTVDNSVIKFEYSTKKDGEYTNTVPALTDSGEHTVYYRATAENHVEKVGEFTVTIDKAEITDFSISQTNVLVYTGDPLSAIVEATGKTVDNSEIKFVYSTEKDGEYTDTIPALTDSGEHTVYYRATAENHVEKVGEFTVTVFIRGDISRNGKIDIYDAIEIAKYVLGVRKFNNEETELADFNNDSEINLYDTIEISKYLLN